MVEPPPAISAPARPLAQCGNCDTVLLGPHCHVCGQPVEGLIRPLRQVVGDLLDDVFDFDHRILRTLGPLLLRPGFLTCEFLAGRRIRYVPPFRLLFFIALVTFFTARMTTSASVNAGDHAIEQATTVAAVEQARDARLAELEAARRGMVGQPADAGRVLIASSEREVRVRAQARIDALRGGATQSASATPAAGAQDLPAPPPGAVHVDWLPASANAWLDGRVRIANANFARMGQDLDAFKDASLRAAPGVLFVLVPVFALLLKLAYAFQHRLMMEHLLVALHSHAFLCLDVMLVLLVNAAGELFATNSLVFTLSDWIADLLLLWAPVYLLLMQKRVYAQGWPITLLKFALLGVVYLILLGLAIASASLIGLVSM